MPDEEAAGPKLGTYTGSYGSSNDKCAFELALLEDQVATIDCIPEVSFSKGGSHPWHVEGTWEWDADDEEVSITITKDDTFGGPKVDRELTIPLEDDTLSFKFATQKADCVWTKPPADKFELEMASLTAKELMAKAIAAGLNAEGCIERGDLEELLRRGKQSGSIKGTLAEIAAAPKPAAPAAAAATAAKAPWAGPKAVAETKPATPAPSPAPAPAPASAPAPAPAPAAAPAPAPAAKEDPPKEAPAAAALAEELAGSPAAAAKEEVPSAKDAPAVVEVTPAVAEAAPTVAEAAPADAEAAPAADAGNASGLPVYTLEQLTQKHIWEKFDLKATEREQYLADSVFEEVFGMNKEAFAKVPKWKKDNLKKQKNLF